MEHLASLVTAIGGAIVGILGAALGYRHKFRKLQTDSSKSHLETFYQTVNGMMNSQEERHLRSMKELRDEQREERAQMAEERKLWSVDRQKLQDKIDAVQAEARKYQNALHDKELEVAELRVEMRLLNERLDAVTTTGAPA